MEVTAALAIGRSLLREHGLDGWRIVADGAKTRAGVCRFGRRQIGISAPLTALHDEAEVRDTILHEIAHALVGPRHGHDAVWRAKAVEIGSSGERCTSPDAPRVIGDWVGRCPAGHQRSRHRAPTRLVSCGHCSARFDVRHLLTWTYKGKSVPMPPSYSAALADVQRKASVETRRRSLRLGDQVRITGDGVWAGRSGEVELVGAARVQVRVGDDLVSLPAELVQPLVADTRWWSATNTFLPAAR
jgi:predicted SprT family Zn-dependent metalloprotease